MKKIFTVCYFINKAGEVLLGEKKVRLGAGCLNGPGGTLESEQSIIENAIDESVNECGLFPIQIKECGISLLTGYPEGEQRELHYFWIPEYRGKLLKESDEMKNFHWHAEKDIPYDKMFRNDFYTLPLFFKREKRICLFYPNESNWIDHRPIIKIVETLPASLSLSDFM